MTPKTIAAWPGKTIADKTHPALWHMLDVGAVSAELMRYRSLTGREDWDQAIVVMIVLHDLGKFSDAFRDMISGRPSYGIRHWQLSFRLLLENDGCVEQLIGGSPGCRKPLYAAVAGHHGGPPVAVDSDGRLKELTAIGQEARALVPEVIGQVASLLPLASLDGLDEATAQKLSWGLSGLTVQADWIGSNVDWFEAKSPDIPVADYWTAARGCAAAAIANAGLHHATPTSRPQVLPAGFTPHPMQSAVADVHLPDTSVLAFIEDATGAGKTEAALILAARMMAGGKGKGLFFALPTMATSNAMLARLEGIVPGLFDGRPSLALSHGRSKQSDLFRDIMGRDGSDPGEDVTCGKWLADDRRRILLADVGVGTIDQALMAVLPTRFNTLRLWALSGRILIVDEAHSYDPFMEEELRRLLQFHALMSGSAIVMTATLPKGMRDGFSRAFRKGLGERRGGAVTDDAYPLLTIVGQKVESGQLSPVPATIRDVAVHRIGSDDAWTLLRDGVAKGAACVWVRNAVDDAIAAVQALRGLGIDAELLHARFTVADRLAKEQQLQVRFGREGTDRAGRILVATQVVEASLDLDFDLMISDLAPIGSLIQRAGRLWRHMDLRPAHARPVAVPALHVVSPDPDCVEDAHWLHGVLDKGAYVYPLDVQWRTARAIFDAGVIRAPDGLRDLIEAVHGDDAMEVPEVLERAEIETTGRHMVERQHAHNMLLRATSYFESAQRVFEEEKLMTRLGQPQATLWLARLTGQGLEPLADDWLMSEVKLSAARWDKLPGVNQEQPEIAAVCKNWKDWQKAAVHIAPVGDGGEICDGLSYNEEFGLVLAP